MFSFDTYIKINKYILNITKPFRCFDNTISVEINFNKVLNKSLQLEPIEFILRKSRKDIKRVIEFRIKLKYLMTKI